MEASLIMFGGDQLKLTLDARCPRHDRGTEEKEGEDSERRGLTRSRYQLEISAWLRSAPAPGFQSHSPTNDAHWHSTEHSSRLFLSQLILFVYFIPRLFVLYLMLVGCDYGKVVGGGLRSRT